MPFYLVTVKNPGRTPRYHEKELGPCNMSPMCTDASGAHHTYLAKAPSAEIIFGMAIKENVHVTRVEEVYHIREYEVADVSVRDDADRPIGNLVATEITAFDPSSVAGFDAIPKLESGERIYYSSDPHQEFVMGVEYTSKYGDPALRARIDHDIASDLGGNDSSGSDGEVPGADATEEIINDIRSAPYPSQIQTPEGDYRIGPDGNSVIGN